MTKKAVRPSTSKPTKLNLLQKGRTKVLSQEEFFELHNSEKKKRKNRKSTIPNSVAKFDPINKKFSLRSGNKMTVVEKSANGVNIYEENLKDRAFPEDMEGIGSIKMENKEKKEKKEKKHKKHKKEKKIIKRQKSLETLIEEYKIKASKKDERERAHFKNGSEGIFLRVYCLNKVLDWVGFGFYHWSIQIYGQEYYYGGHDSEITGIVETGIGKSTSLYLKEILLVGFTYYDADDVDLILDEFGKFWYGCLYDPFRHNCNDFARAVIHHLAHEEGECEFPEYVNRFSKFSSILRVWFEPLKNLFGDIVNAPEPSEDGEEAKDPKNNDIEHGYTEEANKLEKDDFFDDILSTALKQAENSNSYYITGFYDNARNSNLLVLDKIKEYSNDISEIRDLRLQSMFNLVNWCQKLNRIDEMLEYCNNCVIFDRLNPKYYLKRGLALANYQNNYIAALEDLNNAYELDNTNPVIIDEIKKIKEKLEITSGEHALLVQEES